MWRVCSVLVLALSLSAAAPASVNLVTPTDWTGTAYRDSGWFTYRMGCAEEDGSPAFVSDEAFVLSPRFPEQVRRVAMKIACRSLSPTHGLRLAPLRKDIEGDSLAVEDTAAEPAEPGTERTVVVDLPAYERFDAVRLFAEKGGTDVWSVASLCVFSGSQTATDETELEAFRVTPSAPRKLSITDFAAHSLSVRADVPKNAASCRVSIDRLEGVPLTEEREDFAAAPETTSEGWSVTSENAVLDRYTGSTSTDVKTASDETALRIAKDEKGSSVQPVKVEVVSPVFPAPVRECSFACKRTSGESSDVIAVYGARGDSDEWLSVGGRHAVETGMRWITNTVSTAQGFVRLKFVFTADAATCRPCALDTLRIVYGGDQTRVPVVEGALVAADGTFVTNGLETACYAVRMVSVGSNGRTSRPSCEQVVDLSWDQVSVSAPQGVTAAVEEKGLVVGWQNVTAADHYLVTVRKTGVSGEPFVCERSATGTFVVLTALDGVGNYEVTVTAVAPGGKSTAASAAVPFAIAPGQVGEVTAAATDLETIEASWPKVPFAEGYRVTVIGLDGTRRTVQTLTTRQASVTVGGLSCDGRYQLCVSALPATEGSAAAESDEVDMTMMKRRKVDPVSLWNLRTVKCYQEDFSSLAEIRSGVDIWDFAIPHWQLRSGGVEPRRLTATSSCGTSAGGVFIVSDTARSESSYLLATHANGSIGARIGVAFTNDGTSVVCNLALSFDSVQRSFTKEPKTQTVEYLLTAGETDIDANGEWTKLPIEDTAPIVDGSAEAQETEYRREQGPLSLEGLEIMPGQVLILRWRDDARASSPMMGVDNVRLTFDTRAVTGLRMLLQ